MAYSRYADWVGTAAADGEMRVVTGARGVIAGRRFVLKENYCDTIGCDCRNVILQAFSFDRSLETPRATMVWGWESDGWYTEMLGMGDLGEEVLRELRGPALSGDDQTEDAPELLDVLRELTRDAGFVEQIERHYRVVRKHVEAGVGVAGPRMQDLKARFDAEMARGAPAAEGGMNRAERRRAAREKKRRR